MIKAVSLILVIVILLVLAVVLVRAGFGIFRNIRYDSAEQDPMFETPVEIVTRPPELDAEEAVPDHPTLDDYVDEIQTPVDKTADELAGEAIKNK